MSFHAFDGLIVHLSIPGNSNNSEPFLPQLQSANNLIEDADGIFLATKYFIKTHSVHHAQHAEPFRR